MSPLDRVGELFDRLFARWLRTFGRRIVFVVFASLAFVLVAAAIVFEHQIHRQITADAELRYRAVLEASLPEVLDGESWAIVELVRQQMDRRGSLPDSLAAAHAGALEAARKDFALVDEGNRQLPAMFPLFDLPLVVGVSPDGRQIWRSTDRDAEPGTDLSTDPLIATALQGTIARRLVVAGEEGTPGEPAGLFLLQAIPVSAIHDGAAGVIVAGTPLSQSAIDYLSKSTGLEVFVGTRKKLTGPSGFPPAALAGVEALHASRGAASAQDVVLAGHHVRALRVENPIAGSWPGLEVLMLRSTDSERRLIFTLDAWLAGIGAATLLLGMMLGRIFSAPMRLSVERLVEATEAIRGKRYAHRVTVTSRDELATLAESLNRMAERMEKGDFVETSMKLFVPPAYVDYILEHRDELKLGGERRTMSILFADVMGFTALAEKMPPERLVSTVNAHFDLCSRVIATHDGTIDKFIGDAVMAFWNAPVPIEGHAAKSLLAALEMIAVGDYAAREAEARGEAATRCRVGVHTGEAIVGLVGGVDRRNYTALGDAVNIASRLESANKLYGTRILTTAETRAAAGDLVVARFVDRARVVGRRNAVEIHEVLCESGSMPPPRAPEADYLRAWALYGEARFVEAAKAFDALAQQWPDDGPVARLRARCHEYSRISVEGFEGIFDMTEK